MTRSQFILGAALLCVSSTVAFVVSFRHREEANEQQIRVARTPVRPASVRPISSSSESNHPLIRHLDDTHYEVTVSKLEQRTIAAQIERESLSKLDEFTESYNLTGNQRRQIFPLMVSYHPNFEEGLVVNGRVAQIPTKDSLASAVFPLLDLPQQDQYQNDLLADNEWWAEVLTQLRDDLDKAIDSGDIVPTAEVAPPTEDLPSTPREGENIETEAVDLGELFGN